MTAEEQAKMDVLGACTERVEKQFPAVADDASAFDNKTGEVTNDSLRVGSDGHFVFEVPSIAPDRSSPFLFTCTGNTKRRVVETIEFDGKLQRPVVGESWSY